MVALAERVVEACREDALDAIVRLEDAVETDRAGGVGREEGPDGLRGNVFLTREALVDAVIVLCFPVVSLLVAAFKPAVRKVSRYLVTALRNARVSEGCLLGNIGNN